uniref:Uncharacterized protein n=1 Tax=Tetranychus urticae TaxID=32264 RepID=T1KAC8_TETUR
MQKVKETRKPVLKFVAFFANTSNRKRQLEYTSSYLKHLIRSNVIKWKMQRHEICG